MKFIVLSVAILCVAAIACLALSKGFDGVICSLAFTAIGGMSGYAFRFPKKKKRKRQ